MLEHLHYTINIPDSQSLFLQIYLCVYIYACIHLYLHIFTCIYSFSSHTAARNERLSPLFLFGFLLFIHTLCSFYSWISFVLLYIHRSLCILGIHLLFVIYISRVFSQTITHIVTQLI